MDIFKCWKDYQTTITESILYETMLSRRESIMALNQ